MLRYFIFFFAILLVFFLFRRLREDKSFAKEIWSITIALLVMIGFYNYHDDKEQEKINSVLIAYKAGKTLTCEDKKVDIKNFDIEYGTMVFISKKLKDIRYDIAECKTAQ